MGKSRKALLRCVGLLLALQQGVSEENSKADSIGVGVFINERMNEESVRCGKALLECYKRAKAVVAIFEEIGEAENIVKSGTLEHAYGIIQENDWRFKNL